MLRKVLTGLALWLNALGLAPLALGTGIPVVDSLLNSTAAVQLKQQITTATQNVAQTLKQIDQYAQQVRQYQTQLQQYGQQIKDATLPASQIWNQAQGTVRDMMGLVNQAQGGQMLGAFKQTTQKFHRIFGKPLSIIGFCQFRPSQFSAHSKAGFLGDAASPMESTIRSSEKSNSPCKLKCCQVTAEPWRMASISSARRFSFFSAASSRER